MYRKAVLYKDGSVNEASYHPTKEVFLMVYSKHTLIGDWQEFTYEIEED